ncbi:MAG: NEW3 domain-containing protein [Candidatus Nanohaloarchaea archaeon]
MKAEITVPENEELGLKEVVLRAEGRSVSTREISVSVRGSKQEARPEMDMEARKKYIRANPGETISIPVQVRNSGEVGLSAVSISVESPQGWEAEKQPREMEFIRQYDARRFVVRATVPQDAKPGDYFFEVSASSEEAESQQPQRIRVNVSQKSGLRYVGILIMLVSLGALAAVYRKFGRR